MKYDLKAMNFDPDADHIDGAFRWDKTHEGHGYWGDQYNNGITPEGQAKWDAMKQQWNEENGVVRETGTARKLGLQVGDVVNVSEDYRGNNLVIKRVREIPSGECFAGEIEVDFENSPNGIFNDEVFTVLSRATPQRYVVVTDDETVICNRDEAEDLCAGGFDAVYNLGDKVDVTVKVEFN